MHFICNALAHAGKSLRHVVSSADATAIAKEDADATKAQWRKVVNQLQPTVLELTAFMNEADCDVRAYLASENKLEQNDEWAVRHGRYMTLEMIAALLRRPPWSPDQTGCCWSPSMEPI